MQAVGYFHHTFSYTESHLLSFYHTGTSQEKKVLRVFQLFYNTHIYFGIIKFNASGKIFTSIGQL